MIHKLTTRKYGEVLVSNNTIDQIISDDNNNIVMEFPKGLVIRFLKDNEPDTKIIPDVFTQNFKDDDEMRDYIDNNNLLD